MLYHWFQISNNTFTTFRDEPNELIVKIVYPSINILSEEWINKGLTKITVILSAFICLRISTICIILVAYFYYVLISLTTCKKLKTDLVNLFIYFLSIYILYLKHNILMQFFNSLNFFFAYKWYFPYILERNRDRMHFI